MEDYKRKYEQALYNFKKIKAVNKDNKELVGFIEYEYPELKESEDEKIRNFIINEPACIRATEITDADRYEELTNAIAWLEKQGEESKRLYVRFGEIPEDECSGVYHAGELVGKEEGVSVYNAKIDNHNNVLICIPLPINENTLDTFQNLVEYDNRNCYLVKGTCVGKGSDNEPIIRNVSIVKRIDNYRIKESDKKSDQNLDNSCKTCKDEQKPTDKAEPKFKIEKKHWYVCIQSFVLNGNTVVIKGQTYKSQEDNTVSGENARLFIDKHDGDASKYFRPWTIQDAKDGDVLVGNYDNCKKPWIGIFKCISKDKPTTQFDSYCFISSSEHKFVTPESGVFYDRCTGHTIRYALPATKGQRDLLFQKMKESGYEWDAEKKELKKVEQNPAWSEEDEYNLNWIINDYERASQIATSSVLEGHFKMFVNWLKSLKERMKG